MDDEIINPLFMMYSTECDQYSAQIWFGTFFPFVPKLSTKTRISYKPINDRPYTRSVTTKFTEKASDWQFVLPAAKQAWYQRKVVGGLQPGIEYIFTLQALIKNKWQSLSQCYATTLPEKLPATGDDSFTVSLSSCFYEDNDEGRVSKTFKKLYSNKENKPNLKFIVGDIVYADIGIPALTRLSTKEIRGWFLNAYATNFKALRGMLRRGSNFIITDDHEFYNDYPFKPSKLPTLIALATIDGYRSTWTKVAKNCASNALNTFATRFINIGKDLSFCIADLRYLRTKDKLLPERYFNNILVWAKKLKCPGVLVVPQLVMRGKGDGYDHNLADYKTQYSSLIKARILVISAPHQFMQLMPSEYKPLQAS